MLNENNNAMIELVKRHAALINNVETGFQRSIASKLPWDERLIGLKGSRDIGKTTFRVAPQHLNKSTDKL